MYRDGESVTVEHILVINTTLRVDGRRVIWVVGVLEVITVRDLFFLYFTVQHTEVCPVNSVLHREHLNVMVNGQKKLCSGRFSYYSIQIFYSFNSQSCFQHTGVWRVRE